MTIINLISELFNSHTFCSIGLYVSLVLTVLLWVLFIMKNKENILILAIISTILPVVFIVLIQDPHVGRPETVIALFLLGIIMLSLAVIHYS